MIEDINPTKHDFLFYFFLNFFLSIYSKDSMNEIVMHCTVKVIIPCLKMRI